MAGLGLEEGSEGRMGKGRGRGISYPRGCGRLSVLVRPLSNSEYLSTVGKCEYIVRGFGCVWSHLSRFHRQIVKKSCRYKNEGY